MANPYTKPQATKSHRHEPLAIAFLFTFLLLLGNYGWGQTELSRWSFQDVVSPTNVNTNLTASNVTISAGSIAFQNGNDDGGTKIGNSASWNQSDFDTSGKFLEFSFAPKEGYELNLSSISLRFGRTATGPTKVTVQYSLDGFTTTNITILEGGDVASTNAASLDAFTITAGLPENAIKSTMTVRIWGHNASGTGNLRFNNFRVFGTLSLTDEDVIPTPVFSASSGTYFEDQTIFISNYGDYDASATVYYTTDGTDPDSNSDEYDNEEGILLQDGNGPITLKAIAIDSDDDSESNIATAQYVFPVNVADIETLRQQTTGSTIYRVANESTFLAGTSFRNTKFFQDDSGFGIQVDDPTPAAITTTYNIGDNVKELIGTLGAFQNQLQLTPEVDPGGPVSSGNVIVPVVRTLDELSFNDQSRLVKVLYVEFEDGDGTNAFGEGGFSTDITDPSIAGFTGLFRNVFGESDITATLIPEKIVNIVGIIQENTAGYNLAARNLADIEEVQFVSFFFRGPSWMNNDPHNPEIWGPFNGWSEAATMAFDAELGWWFVKVEVEDAMAEITYQTRFSENGATKYQKAFDNFGADPSFTTTTGEIWIDASDNDSFTWQGNDFYLSEDKITEEQPVVPAPEIAWANLQWPPDGQILTGGDYLVYARVYIAGLTGSEASEEDLEDLSVWIGYSATDATTTDDFEDGWTWVQASLNTYEESFGNNSQYSTDIGSPISEPGTYYYVSRFQLGEDPFVYGGFQGGYWDGATNVSGELTVNTLAELDVDDNEITLTWNAPIGTFDAGIIINGAPYNTDGGFLLVKLFDEDDQLVVFADVFEEFSIGDLHYHSGTSKRMLADFTTLQQDGIWGTQALSDNPTRGNTLRDTDLDGTLFYGVMVDGVLGTVGFVFPGTGSITKEMAFLEHNYANGDYTLVAEFYAPFRPGDVGATAGFHTLEQLKGLELIATAERPLSFQCLAPEITAVDLLLTDNPAGPWTAANGNFNDGFSVCLNPNTEFYYLGMDNLTGPANPLLANTFEQNAFYLDTDALPTGFYDYWDVRGVNASASGGWEAVMWQIITGNQPMFYIKFDGTDYELIDGLHYQAGLGEETLAISGDYPQGTYTFTGAITDENLCVSSTIEITLDVYPEPVITSASLLASTDRDTWEPVSGSLADGYTLWIGAANAFYYFGIDQFISTVGLSDEGFLQNAFFLNTNNLPEGYYDYWAGKGVNASATDSWQAVMWQIINGDLPMFYISYDGADHMLVDALHYHIGEGVHALGVSGDYPEGSYTFSGTVTSENGCVSTMFDVVMEFLEILPLAATCPENVTLPACSTEQEVQDAFTSWIAGFGYSGGCDVAETDLSAFSAPPPCGGSVTVNYLVSDNCGQEDNCTASFIVPATPLLTVNCPGNLTVNEGDDIATAFAQWISAFSHQGGCDPTATDLSSYSAPASGESVTVVYEAADECQTASCTATFTVSADNIPDNLVLTENVSVPAGDSRCFNAYLSILVGGDYAFEVEAGASVELRAGEQIIMMPGVRVMEGGYLLAQITDQYCPVVPPMAPLAKADIAEDVVTNIEFPDTEKGNPLFKVFPNPTPGAFTLEIDYPSDEPHVYIEIYSMLGNRVLSERLPAERQYSLSLEGQQPGIYIVRVLAGNSVSVERLIKR